MLNKKKSIILYLFFIVNILYLNFIKNIELIFLETYKYNNYIWDYVLILNNNNKSLFLFFIFYFAVFLNNKVKKQIYLFIFMFIIIDTRINNLNLFYFSVNKINIDLMNGLIIIHPLFIYITYIIFIYLLYSYYTRNKMKINKYIKKIKYENKRLVFYSTSALILGSW